MLNVVGGSKAILPLEPYQGPVLVRLVVDVQLGILGKGEFLLGLSGIVVERLALADGFCLLGPD